MQIDLAQVAALVGIMTAIVGSSMKLSAKLTRIETTLAAITARCDERHNGPQRRRTLELEATT